MKQKLFTLLTLLVLCVTGAWATITPHDLSSSNFTKDFSSESDATIDNKSEHWGMYFKGACSISSKKLALNSSNMKTNNYWVSIPLTGIAKDKVIAVSMASSVKIKFAVEEKTDYTGDYDSETPTETVNPISSTVTYNYKMTGTGGNAVLYFGRDGSNVSISNITIKVADPIANPVFTYATGTYYTGLVPAITCATDGVTIYYKNDDRNDRKDITSTGAISAITGNKTFSSYALKDGVYSDIVKATYTISSIPTPEVNIAAGTYSTTQSISFTTELLSNGVIKYTTDGNTPTWASTSYDGTPISITSTTTLKAIVFETTGNGSKKGSTFSATYTIVEATDPVFSLSATSIPSNSTAQIKVGSNAGLDGVTLSNIAYGTDGIVTVNASTGVVTPVAVGTTTITFDTEETAKYNASTGNELTITVVSPKCAKPTVTISDFNFENKKYVISVTNNEAESTLKVSTDGGSSWSDATTSYDVTSTATYNFKSVKDSYDDSDVATASITHDPLKKNIAWVYEDSYKDGDNPAYNYATDKMVIALQSIYNLIPVKKGKTTTMTASNDIKNSDLIISSEAMAGGQNLAKSMNVFVGVAPMINLKFWSYKGSDRWNWADNAYNPELSSMVPESTSYKVLDGVTLTAGAINMFDDATGTRMQNVTWNNEPANNVNMAKADNKVCMHAIVDEDHLDKQFFGLGLSCNNATKYSTNAVTIIKNAARMLIAGEKVTAEYAPEPSDPTVEGTTVTLATTANMDGWRSYNNNTSKKYTVSANTKVYYAAATGENKVTLEEIAGGVPANTAVILHKTDAAGTAATITLTETATDITAPVSNELQVSTAGQNLGKVYRLGYKSSDGVGFYTYTTTSAPEGIIYVSSVSGANFLSLDFGEGEGDVTNISEIEKKRNAENEAFFNLAGQRVAQPTKGLYIVNGKKVVLK